MSKNNNQDWHTKKGVSYAHIIATVGLFFGLVTYIMEAQARLTTVEVGQVYTNQMLERIENKLDKLDDRLHQRASK